MTGIRAEGAPVFLGSQHLSPEKGGIAVVARLTARVLSRMGRPARLLSLLDERDGELEGLAWRSTRSNRLAFVSRCHLAALSCNRFVYDSVSTARGHPRLGALRRPYALWMHGIEVWYSLHKDRARALRAADLVLVNSYATLEKFRNLHGQLETAKVCLLGTEADEPPEPGPGADGPPTVLVLARMDIDGFYKGHKELIACWPEVVAAVPGARLVIAGGGSGLEHVRGLVSASTASPHIEVKGFVPDEALPGLWRSANVFAMPSRNEGFGLVYAEAMRHGLPVIASVHDAGREVNLDGATGYNVDLDSAHELPERLISLLGAPEQARRMGQNGHERWHTQFRFSAFETRLRGILEPFLDHGGRHGGNQHATPGR